MDTTPGYRVQDKNYRAWINTPSSFDPDHEHHGKVGIVVNDDGGDFVRMYFTEGNIFSMMIARLSISKYHTGNPNHSFNNLERS